MLRNQQKCKLLIQHHLLRLQQRLFQQQSQVLYNKSTNVFGQGKIMGKLLGNRVSGSKKRWIPSADATNANTPSVLFRQTTFGKAGNSGGKNATRRMVVLNKLFMKHVTDLMATGEISEFILGKGLQVSGVKITQDFAYVNVFWLSTGEPIKDAMLEQELQRCAGLLRHELSQLRLMGVVPRINFVKDKLFNNTIQVEALLKNMDFTTEDEIEDKSESTGNYGAEKIKQDFYGNRTSNVNLEAKAQVQPENLASLQALNNNVPQMRHDVMALDHKGIMFKILTKMRKSKQAWYQYQQNANSTDDDTHLQMSVDTTIPSTSYGQLLKMNEKLAKTAGNSDKFEEFLAKRREKRNTPERKRFRAADHQIETNDVENDYSEIIMSAQLKPFFEAEDYLPDEFEDKKLN